MKKCLGLLAARTRWSGGAGAQSAADKTGVNSVLGLAPTTQDFVKEAVTSDMLEIAAAKVAQQRGNMDERKFAAQMITDHTKTSADIESLI